LDLKEEGWGIYVVEFNNRFNKLYNKIPHDIKPSQETTKVTYAGAFEADFSMMLRERRYTTLIIMQDDAIYIEGNMNSSCKLKPRAYQIDKYKKKQKDEVGTSGSSKDSQEAKIEEMSRLIKKFI
jgi:hypothetical protein